MNGISPEAVALIDNFARAIIDENDSYDEELMELANARTAAESHLQDYIKRLEDRAWKYDQLCK